MEEPISHDDFTAELPAEMTFLPTLVITFNCGRELIKPDVFSRHLIDELPDLHVNSPEIIVISLQELAPISYAFLGGVFLQSYLSRVHQTIDLVGKAWDRQYSSLLTRNVGMTAIMIFVRADVANRIQTIEVGGIGVGWNETGNKGAVGVRLGYATRNEIMDLTFLAAHLAPHEKLLKKRNEDWMNIVRGLVFTPVDEKKMPPVKSYRRTRSDEDTPLLYSSDGETIWSGIYTPTSHLIVAGDLNYRVSSIGPKAKDFDKFPKPYTDYLNFLQNDQLRAEIQAERALHGFSEAEIAFPPSYKYSDAQRANVAAHEARLDKASVSASNQDSDFGWATHRWPSWCDRILYRKMPPWAEEDSGPPVKINIHKYTSLPLMSTSDHQPVVLSLSIPLKQIPLPPKEYDENDWHVSPPYAINPQWRQKRAAARTREFVIGLFAYLGMTWEGNGYLVATILGALGGWAIIKGILLWTEE